MAAPLEIEAISKSYGKTLAVSELSLFVPQQSVYGFLGPNGAGKSTTIRMVLGLQRPDRGTISLFGHPQSAARMASLRRVGSLVESPSLYQHLTGRENLELHRRLLSLSTDSIDEVLKTVELTSVADRLVRTYSLGMKQRLGLAQALLGNPELLILDEPTNGLDPAGIHEVRSLLINLVNRRDVTVFISSHLLSEIEQIATHLAIISEGVLRFEGTQQELRARATRKLVIDVDQPDRAQVLLAGSGHTVKCEGNRIVVEANDADGPAQLNAVLVRAGIAVSHLSTQQHTLEGLFLELTAPFRTGRQGTTKQ